MQLDNEQQRKLLLHIINSVSVNGNLQQASQDEL